MAAQRHLPPCESEPVPGRVVVVGVCASGKTTLVEQLCRAGYDARSCAQEHSYVPDLWQRLARPAVLVYLQASFDAVRSRRAIDWGEEYLQEQQRRLEHARQHCQLFLDTDDLGIAEVYAATVRALEELGIRPQAAQDSACRAGQSA